ncbi:MAG: tetratricopeptide repeat protein [Bdellovibrionaceae bacterium]|nr:tetratricopeptide repeat protein [Pseudobdellovibrionaceae bacterium]
MKSAPLNPEFVERYQLEYQKNPRSKVFAPLAEAYRKMGLLEEARTVAQSGVKHHPDFASGRVVYARILFDSQNYDETLNQLIAAVRLSPDNLMAHSLMGETLLLLRRPKDALNAFKMVLFVDPSHERALAAVRKWEFLTADEYDDELFEVKSEPTNGAAPPAPHQAERIQPIGSIAEKQKHLERALSLADAFTVRNDIERALETLTRARQSLGAAPELDNRLARLRKRMGLPELAAEPTPPSTPGIKPETRPVANSRKQKLEILLRRINERRLDH